MKNDAKMSNRERDKNTFELNMKEMNTFPTRPLWAILRNTCMEFEKQLHIMELLDKVCILIVFPNNN